jgi:hypothetical protein
MNATKVKPDYCAPGAPPCTVPLLCPSRCVRAGGSHLVGYLPATAARWLADNLKNALILNVVLAVFNLFPLPPLDGWTYPGGNPPSLGCGTLCPTGAIWADDSDRAPYCLADARCAAGCRPEPNFTGIANSARAVIGVVLYLNR